MYCKGGVSCVLCAMYCKGGVSCVLCVLFCVVGYACIVCYVCVVYCVVLSVVCAPQEVNMEVHSPISYSPDQ